MGTLTHVDIVDVLLDEAPGIQRYLLKHRDVLLAEWQDGASGDLTLCEVSTMAFATKADIGDLLMPTVGVRRDSISR